MSRKLISFIEALWEKDLSELRFGQMVVCIARKAGCEDMQDLFYIENKDFFDAAKRWKLELMENNLKW